MAPSSGFAVTSQTGLESVTFQRRLDGVSVCPRGSTSVHPPYGRPADRLTDASVRVFIHRMPWMWYTWLEWFFPLMKRHQGQTDVTFLKLRKDESALHMLTLTSFTTREKIWYFKIYADVLLTCTFTHLSVNYVQPCVRYRLKHRHLKFSLKLSKWFLATRGRKNKQEQHWFNIGLKMFLELTR